MNASTARKFRPTRVPTGITAIDQMHGGGLTIGTCNRVTGHPGGGKSALLAYMAGQAARPSMLSKWAPPVFLHSGGMPGRFLDLMRTAGVRIEEAAPRLSVGQLEDLLVDPIDGSDVRVLFVDDLPATLFPDHHPSRITSMLHQLDEAALTHNILAVVSHTASRKFMHVVPSNAVPLSIADVPFRVRLETVMPSTHLHIWSHP